MANISDIINKKEFDNALIPQEDTPDLIKTEKEIRQNKVDIQLAALFKTKKRPTPPTATELKELIEKYFNETYPENYALFTLHVFLGMTQSNIETHIMPNDELKEIYEFALEKFKAKGEITMHIAGRSSDAFYMQNIAKWRKKDPEEEEKQSGLAELHRGINQYQKSKPNN